MRQITKAVDYVNTKIISWQIFLVRFVFGLLFNFRLIGIVSLTFIAIVSLFGWQGARLTSEVLVLCGMIFLSSVFSELKSWDFFKGLLKGETRDRDLSTISSNGGIDKDKPKPNEETIEKAENTPLQLMAYDKGNFLALAFEIERLLRILATVSLAKDIPSNIDPGLLVTDLHSNGMLTDLGKQQIEAIRWIRDILVYGRESEINQETLFNGIRIAYSLYTEIYNWLNQPQQSQT